jgi:tetratricopeptide (TPR) repeat protein
MLETVREYAGELLAASCERETTAQAHLLWYEGLAARAAAELRGPDQAVWLDLLDREQDNVRAALSWALGSGWAESGLRLVGAFWLFWHHRGSRREGLDWIERLLAAGASADRAVTARALHAAGRLAEGESYGSSMAWHERSLAIYRELDDRRGVAEALRGIALAAGNQGDHGRAIRLLEEAVRVLRELDEPVLLASALMNLGVAVSLGGDPCRSTLLYEQALALRRRAGDALGTALCLINLGSRARLAGDLDLAQARLEEAIAIARGLGSHYHLAAGLANLGDLARTRGDVSEAEHRYRESMRLFAEAGERPGVGVCVRWLGWVAWTRGSTQLAVRLYGAAESLCPMATAPDSAEGAIHEQARASLRGCLGAGPYAAAYEAGGRLSLERAVAEAEAGSAGEERVSQV